VKDNGCADPSPIGTPGPRRRKRFPFPAGLLNQVTVCSTMLAWTEPCTTPV
jgi:hypothetical protein